MQPLRPGSFKTALKTAHANDEVVDLHVAALVQVSQDPGDLSSNLLLVIRLSDHTVGLSSR